VGKRGKRISRASTGAEQHQGWWQATDFARGGDQDRTRSTEARATATLAGSGDHDEITGGGTGADAIAGWRATKSCTAPTASTATTR